MHKAVMTLALGLAMSLPAAAQTIYRTTDAQGNTVFTDDPQRGGEAVELDPLTVVPSRPVQPLPSASAGQAGSATRYGDPGQPFMPYDVFAIASPAPETTVPTGAAGNVQVQLAIRPALRDDHRVRLLVDGQISQSAMHTDTFLLSNLDRGEHRVQAELLDASGAVRHRTSPLTIYVQRASVYLPSNPNNPANN
ncbi:DUF4124 domain-containing protein [Halomonas getboli]|uniref:DUF4124 domain-containing protein n=1 Tax=Halomonas getboli TaxID=2935862 RepID=UPI001FFF0BF7|nr:DUF4124 domain-containing protein [Halomonas getboli]MCK2185230.1 DUF4124 domain-containing protein [Halomonas getboli]